MADRQDVKLLSRNKGLKERKLKQIILLNLFV